MSNNHTVTVYSTPTCPYCTMSKNWLAEKGVAFTDIDVSRDHAAAQAMVNKTGQMGVPVIEIDGEVILGYQPAEFERLLA